MALVPSAQGLLAASQSLFDAFREDASSISLLEYFSSSKPVIIQHAPSTCPHPRASRLIGANAVRSYFDLLSTHFVRSKLEIHGSPIVELDGRRVKLEASVAWTWKRSGRTWSEDFTWCLDYDEQLKIMSFIVETTSGPGTCVMKAVDNDPLPPVKGRVPAFPLLVDSYPSAATPASLVD